MFIDNLLEFKEIGSVKFDSNKQTTSAIVKELLPKQFNDNKKSYKKFTNLIDLLNFYVNKTVPNLNTKVMTQSYVRKLVKDTYGDNSKHYLYLKNAFSMTSEERKTRQTDAQNKVIESNESQIEITVSQLNQFIEKLSTTKFKIIPSIIMAQIACGGRLIEILSSDFEFNESKTKGYIIQSNVAKNRTDAERSVDKPVLFITPTAFLSLIKEIRLNLTNKPDDTNIKLSNRYGKRVNASVVKIAGEVGMPLEISSSHDMRRIYANYSYILHAKRNVSLQIWIAQILGHGDLTSTANYSTLKII
jgi:hypothetical protein